MYIIRNKDGFMVAKVSDYIAKVIITKSIGKITNKTFDSGIAPKVYMIDEDGSFFLGKGEPEYMKIFFWKGYFMYAE